MGLLACVLLLGLVECGGSDDTQRPSGSAGSSGSGGGDSSGTGGKAGKGGTGREDPGGAAGAPEMPASGCLEPTAEDYEPVWMPPRAVPGACTSEQIADAYRICSRSSIGYDELQCRAFNVNPENGDCLGCLFSAVGDEPSGAILILPGNNWQANVGGCIALLDGDTSPTSCGARTQASDVCQYGACLTACAGPNSQEDWDACRVAAGTACAEYADQAACRSLPRYAACGYPSFEEYVLGIGNQFCGPPDGSGGAGAGGAGGAEMSAGGAAGGL